MIWLQASHIQPFARPLKRRARMEGEWFPLPLGARPHGKLTVFNLGGNKARLVAALHFNRRKVYIRAVLTHAEYDTGAGKK